MRVKDVMKEWVKVSHETTVTELAKTLEKHATGSALVVEGGSPLGVVTERDILRKVVAAGKDPAYVTVKRIMNSPVITIDAGEDVSKASEIMDKKMVRRLAVVSDGKIIGKITTNIVSKNIKYIIGRQLTHYRPYEEER